MRKAKDDEFEPPTFEKGSHPALADTNGAVVERYVYNPYGETIVQQTGFYHDADLDGDIDAADEADLEECADDRPTDPLCVFVHDRNGDQVVDAVDLGLFAGFSGFDSNGTTPPADFERTHGPWFDANADGELDVFDFNGYQQCLGATDAVCLYLYDADNDDDVDLGDFVEFQDHWGEAGVAHTLSPIPDSGAGPTAGSKYGNPFMWTGQRYDPAVGLYHFLFRSYSPTLGRWLQRDPLGYVDSASLYEYVSSSPSTGFDPLGLDGDSDGPPAPPSPNPPPDPTPPNYDASPLTPWPSMRGHTGTVDELIAELLGFIEDNRNITLWDLQAFIGASPYRYVWVEGFGWLDMQHFFASAFLQQKAGRVPAWIVALLKELSDFGDDSFFREGDWEGNEAGRLFMRWFHNRWGYFNWYDFLDALGRWLEGERAPYEPAPRIPMLPIPDTALC